MALRSKKLGFTIIELLLVIAIIGILSVVVIVAYNGVQQRARVASLVLDLKQLNTQISTESVVIGGLFPDSLEAMNNGNGVSYSGDATLMYTPDNDSTPSDYCLTAILGTVVYHVTRYTPPTEGYCPGDEPAGIPDAPIAQTNSDSTTQITVSWDPVEDATSYTVKRSSSASMSSPTTVSNISGTSQVVSGLTQNTTYYFTVSATGTAGTGPESDVVSETTQIAAPAGAPTLSVVVNSPTQITANWTAVAGSTSYKLDYSTSSTFATVTTVSGIVPLTKAVTGLSPGVRYYFRAFAVNGAVAGPASNSVNGITTIAAPDSPTVTVTIPGSSRAASSGPWAKTPAGAPTSGTWYYAKAALSSSTCAAGTTKEFRTRIQYSSPQTFGAWTSWTTGASFYAIQPNSPYGIRFQAQSHCKTSLKTSTESSSGYGCRYQSGSTSCSAW